jgi:hypothetical protein
MAHSEIDIVPVPDVGIRTCSQSVTAFADIFPWTRVKKGVIQISLDLFYIIY